MADDNGSDRTPRLGGWRNDKGVEAGEAAAAGAAGRPSCCAWRMAMAGRSGSQGWGGLTQ